MRRKLTEMEFQHTTKVIRSGRGISIEFTPPVSTSPGVYRVVRKEDKKTFYVGECGNLYQRLRFLFRCYPCNNPHPCHCAFRRAYGSFPTPDQFCEIFEIYVQDTSELKGRLEIEEELQEKHGSNNADFYRNWKTLSDFTPSPETVSEDNPESYVVGITKEMRRSGTWFFPTGLADLLPESGGLVRIIFPNNVRVDGRIGRSRSKYLNGARSSLKELVEKHPEATSFCVEFGFEGETPVLLIKT
jgi:hypothetical protein